MSKAALEKVLSHVYTFDAAAGRARFVAIKNECSKVVTRMRMLWVAAGFAAGYVMGSKAGRERYEQIKQVASDFAHTPVVADIQSKAKGLAERGAEAIMEKTGLTSTDQHTADPVAMAVPQARPVK